MLGIYFFDMVTLGALPGAEIKNQKQGKEVKPADREPWAGRMLRVRETREWIAGVPRDAKDCELDQHLLARYVVEEGEEEIQFICIYSVYELGGRLWVQVCQHRRDNGFTLCDLYEIRPSEIRVFFGPEITREILQKLSQA